MEKKMNSREMRDRRERGPQERTRKLSFLVLSRKLREDIVAKKKKKKLKENCETRAPSLSSSSTSLPPSTHKMRTNYEENAEKNYNPKTRIKI